jgi:hypothetical protein
LLSEKQRRENLLDDRVDRREGQRWIGAAPYPLALQKGVRDGREHHVMLPPRIRAAFEMVEAEFGLEFLVLLLDGPALMCQPLVFQFSADVF